MPEQESMPLVLVAGTATGEVLRLDEPLSFWGGMETVGGRIIDQRHPQVGEIVTGRVLVMPFGRGSSSGSSVICEAVRAGTAPAAILMAERDDIIALGAIAADEVYGLLMPVVVLAQEELDGLQDGAVVTVEVDGTVEASEGSPDPA
jgi:predicted aconitase with swiveling domain